jgi:hypothetical protein
VRSRNQDSFDEIAETTLEGESAIFFKNEMYKGPEKFSVQCTICKKMGHTINRCYLKHKQEGKVEVSHFKTNNQRKEFTCWNCGEKGHSSRFCRKPRKNVAQEKRRTERSGNESRPSGSTIDGPYYSIGCIREGDSDFLEFDVDISKGERLKFLLDTGAEFSLIKSPKLIGTTEFDPSQRVRVKCVNGSIVETHGMVNECVSEGPNQIRFNFQLVNKQVDLAYDGIIGRDFLRSTMARFCFKNNRVVFNTPEGEWTKTIGEERGGPRNGRVYTIKVPRRSEMIMKIPVENAVDGAERITEKRELTKGVYLASSLIKVVNNQAITSILNTNNTEVVIEISQIRWENFDVHEGEGYQNFVGSLTETEGGTRNREQEVLKTLELENMISEERQVIEKTCKDFQDIFYLPGDSLSCTTTVKHSINVVPGTSPVHTRPYRLPESQKAEIESQVNKLLKEGIIAVSNSPWNSPLLIVSKKSDNS